MKLVLNHYLKNSPIMNIILAFLKKKLLKIYRERMKKEKKIKNISSVLSRSEKVKKDSSQK